MQIFALDSVSGFLLGSQDGDPMIQRHRMLPTAGGASRQPVLSQLVSAALVLTCFAWCMCGLAAGQAATSLRGTITDPSGSTLAGAKVVLANSESKTERTATTAEQKKTREFHPSSF